MYGFPLPQGHEISIKFFSGWTTNLAKLGHTGRKSNTNCHASEEPNLILHPLAEGSAAKELIGEFHKISVYNTTNCWVSQLLSDTKLRKNILQQIVGSYLAGNLSQIMKRLFYIHRYKI